ncbi:hypothetical protein [Pseudoalteromonas luteoviolacea]|uniref:hypothetical protein n=1 Tax=Pseudoalteromonas luteoviolacea TaxID=43657 RepID=UPI00114E4D65|nr:hypothetical protein [Pseudoalteromonas luteoviolacea]TQF67845.1 hypothetical protein FLM44_21945 [Pseudoalteromonas luteoviolacea]
MMRINRFNLLFPITAFMSGCSTLLIEVDVYNGPLNSQATERLDQVAAMVTAARPMLGYIRDTYKCDDELISKSSTESEQLEKLESCRRINPIEVDRYRTYPSSAKYLAYEGDITYYLANEILHMYTNEQGAFQTFKSNYNLLFRKLKYQDGIYAKLKPNKYEDQNFIQSNFSNIQDESNEVKAVKSFIAPLTEKEQAFESVFCKPDQMGPCEDSNFLIDAVNKDINFNKIIDSLTESHLKNEQIDSITERFKNLSLYYDSAWLAANESLITAAKTVISLEELLQSNENNEPQLTNEDVRVLKNELLSVLTSNADLEKLQQLSVPKCSAELKINQDVHLFSICILAAQAKLDSLGMKTTDLDKRLAKAPNVDQRLNAQTGEWDDLNFSRGLKRLGSDTSRGLELVINDYKLALYYGCYETDGKSEHDQYNKLKHDIECENAKDVKREFQSDLKSFSEKILFLANNLVLLHGNANLDDSEEDKNTAKQQVKKFIAVLQAIGNSTKVLANDIERQSQFTKRNNGDHAKLLKNAIANTIRSESSNITEDLALWLDSEERLKPESKCHDNNKAQCERLTNLKATLKSKCLAVEANNYVVSVNWRAKNIVNCIVKNYQTPKGKSLELKSAEQKVLNEYQTQLRETTTKHNLPDFNKDDELSSSLNTEQVWDSLLYHLAVERVLADKRGDTEKVKRLNKALETARYFRSENSFLRATSDAIRMTMRPTTLLDNSELMQRKRFLNRSLVQSSNAILQKLDNQNWHNINRVAVKGGGDVNYVVAKDDIGNWYIKQYSEDKKEMIDSIKNIALFNIKKSNISNLAGVIPNGVNQETTQSTSEKVFTSFLHQHTLPLRDELVKQKSLLDNLDKYNAQNDKLFLGLKAAKTKTKKIIDDTKALKSSSRSQIANGVLENIYLLARFHEALGECTNDATVKKEQCTAIKQQIANKVRVSVTIMRQHTSQVEPFVLAFIGAVQD